MYVHVIGYTDEYPYFADQSLDQAISSIDVILYPCTCVRSKTTPILLSLLVIKQCYLHIDYYQQNNFYYIYVRKIGIQREIESDRIYDPDSSSYDARVSDNNDHNKTLIIIVSIISLNIFYFYLNFYVYTYTQYIKKKLFY